MLQRLSPPPSPPNCLESVVDWLCVRDVDAAQQGGESTAALDALASVIRSETEAQCSVAVPGWALRYVLAVAVVHSTVFVSINAAPTPCLDVAAKLLESLLHDFAHDGLRCVDAAFAQRRLERELACMLSSTRCAGQPALPSLRSRAAAARTAAGRGRCGRAHASEPGDGARRDADRRCDLLRARRLAGRRYTWRLAPAVRNVPSRGRGSERRSAPRPHLCDEPIERPLLLGMGSAAAARLSARARRVATASSGARVRAAKRRLAPLARHRAIVDVSAAAECHLFLQCGLPERLYRDPPAQLRRRVSYRAQRHAVPGLDCACVSVFVARIGLPDYHGAGW